MAVESVVENHFRETERLLRAADSKEIADWLLTEGYFPEPTILPPSFFSHSLSLQPVPYNKNIGDPARRHLLQISYPKSLLSSRVFSIQHPWNYHDIVFHLHQAWPAVLDILFRQELRIFSYSMPIPLSRRSSPHLGRLRSGRLIYEWIGMAERDLVVDAARFSFIAKTDITNFYNSIYTHSIAWALEGREESFEDKAYVLPGTKIDRLVQYANDARTNGIPVGSVLSDLLAEIVLSAVDLKVSQRLTAIEFVAVRFKDDYRILTKSQDAAREVLSVLAAELHEYNLTLNEGKTSIRPLPDGLYRAHDREYFPHSLREAQTVSFKCFEHTLLIALDIHRKFPGTSILEKFLSELIRSDKTHKVAFSQYEKKRLLEIRKVFSLLFLLKRESAKLTGTVLAHVELVYRQHVKNFDGLKPYLRNLVEVELCLASEKKSEFEAVWLIFFARFVGLGIAPDELADLIKPSGIRANPFVESMLMSQGNLFKDTSVSLFRAPKNCKECTLVEHLDVFRRAPAAQHGVED
jgi:retron-type reverse transcriptase